MPPLTLPPPFKLAVLDRARPAFAEARARAVAGVEHGRLAWRPEPDRLDAALTLEPEHGRVAALAFVDTAALLALYRAIAARLPPGVPLHRVPPRGLLLDGAPLCALDVALADGERPAWLVIGLDVPLRGGAPPATLFEGGLETAGFEGGLEAAGFEGGPEAAGAGALLTGFCRHLLGLADAFEADGGAALAEHVRAITFEGAGASEGAGVVP